MPASRIAVPKVQRKHLTGALPAALIAGILRLMSKDTARKHLSLKVDVDLLDRFQLAAKANQRSQNGEVRHLIRKRVTEFEAQLGEAA